MGESNGVLMSQKMFIHSQIVLRITASLAILAATLVMALSKQTSDFAAGFRMTASYSLSPTFKFFVGGNAASFGYLLLSLPFVSNLVNGCLCHVLDMVSMALMIASASAATAIAYVGKKGNNDIGWSEVCTDFNNFCTKAEVSIALSYAGFLLLLVICILSSVHKN